MNGLFLCSKSVFNAWNSTAKVKADQPGDVELCLGVVIFKDLCICTIKVFEFALFSQMCAVAGCLFLPLEPSWLCRAMNWSVDYVKLSFYIYVYICADMCDHLEGRFKSNLKHKADTRHGIGVVYESTVFHHLHWCVTLLHAVP